MSLSFPFLNISTLILDYALLSDPDFLYQAQFIAVMYNQSLDKEHEALLEKTQYASQKWRLQLDLQEESCKTDLKKVDELKNPLDREETALGRLKKIACFSFSTAQIGHPSLLATFEPSIACHLIFYANTVKQGDAITGWTQYLEQVSDQIEKLKEMNKLIPKDLLEKQSRYQELISSTLGRNPHKRIIAEHTQSSHNAINILFQAYRRQPSQFPVRISHASSSKKASTPDNPEQKTAASQEKEENVQEYPMRRKTSRAVPGLRTKFSVKMARIFACCTCCQKSPVTNPKPVPRHQIAPEDSASSQGHKQAWGIAPSSSSPAMPTASSTPVQLIVHTPRSEAYTLD